jgi:hypothetical protein
VKKYRIRDGFIVNLTVTAANGEAYEKKAFGGEVVELEDDVAEQHLHKLEFADKKDRDAAAKAEQDRKLSSMGASNPAELIRALVAALAQAQTTAGAPAAPSVE